MKKNKTIEVSKQRLGQIRNKIEEFKRRQRKNDTHTKLYIDTNKALEIYQTIDAIQQVPPYKGVRKGDIASKKPNLSDRQIRRGLQLLCRLEILNYLKREREHVHQYWIPKYEKKSLEITKRKLQIERAAKIKAEKEVETVKQEKKELLKKNKKILTDKEYFAGAYNAAKPYLDNLRYCESDLDWELLTKWFMKMQENKHYQEEAEAWEEQQKFQYEKSREIDQDKKS